MVSLTVNGKLVTGKDSTKLIDFLREELCLTSVKNGCGQGACGACSVLCNGKVLRACVMPLAKLAGQNIVTVEGLSQREKDVYAHAFAAAGAVQCGFCIPGMVIAAKALLAQEKSPTPQQIKKALRGNICRCTGYAKIEDALALAAKMFRENTPIPPPAQSWLVGQNLPRVDAKEKTLGTGIYVDDISIDNMLFASCLRPPAPRVKLLKIDTSLALAHPDCAGVYTAKDVPGNNKIGHLSFVSDWDVFIAEGDTTRYVGDALALVVCHKKESLDHIKSLIKIEYQELAPISSPAMALEENAPKLHPNGNILSFEHLVRGDVDAALKACAYVVTQHYSVPFTEHAFMEPECAIAMPEGEDGLLIYTGGQSVYDEQREIARMLGIDAEKVHVQGKLVGGGFGGKEDMSVQHHAALAAWKLKKPVKVLLSRQESIAIHPKRHAMEMDFTTGCDENGKLCALRATIVADTGAYASLGGPVLQRACTHAAGPYNFSCIDIKGTAVYTNNPPGGAFRGFGVCQTAFAMENNMNLLAKAVGISPWQIRHINAVRPGNALPNGQLVNSTAAIEGCLLAVKDAYDEAIAKGRHAGIACFFKNSGVGVGLPDTGRCIVCVQNGKVHIRTSAACIGQGLATVTTQIACQTLGLSPSLILAEPPDTKRTPNSGTTTASRQTFFTGEATRLAAQKLKDALDAGKTLQELDGQEFYGEYNSQTDPLGSQKPNPVSHVAYGFAAQVVFLDEDGRVDEVYSAFDLGQVVNPKAAQGQVEGGILMGLGYALTEDYPLENCVPKAKYGTLGLWRSTDAPKMHTQFVVGSGKGKEAYGAKGVGELATIPTAPAVCGAYFAKDGLLRNSLPMQNTYYKKLV